MKRIRDWIFSIPMLVAIGVSLLVMDPVLRVVRLFSLEAFERLLARLQVWIVRFFWFCKLRIDLELPDGFDPDRPAIFVSNHQSNFDVPLLGALLHTRMPKFPAHHRLGRWIPVVSHNLQKGGFALVDPERPRDTLRAIRDMAATAAARGRSLVIFPEGKRARDGVLLPFHIAGTATMMKAAPAMPVVPVAIDGAAHLMEHGLFPAPFGARIRVRVGEPIERAPDEDAGEVFAQVRAAIEATLEEWRV